MFTPPRCPRADCAAHAKPPHRFFTRKGSYQPLCRASPVPRFRCRVCRRGFSRQTFRVDYCDNKPWLNARLFDLLASGLGLRQSGRLLSLSRSCTDAKFRKLAQQLDWLHSNMIGEFAEGTRFTMDEMETFETCRSTRPLTLPVIIDHESLFVVAAECAPIKPSGAMPEHRKKLIRRDEAIHGVREDRSKECLERVLGVVKKHIKAGAKFTLRSDEKGLYRTVARRLFGDAVTIEQYPGKAPRNTLNPLFRINLTNAIARDLNGRLRRRSWLVSKRGEFLNLQLAIFQVYRNYVRRRINRDPWTPAQALGFASRPLNGQEVLSWRQDWGPASIRISGSRRAASMSASGSAARSPQPT